MFVMGLFSFIKSFFLFVCFSALILFSSLSRAQSYEVNGSYTNSSGSYSLMWASSVPFPTHVVEYKNGISQGESPVSGASKQITNRPVGNYRYDFFWILDLQELGVYRQFKGSTHVTVAIQPVPTRPSAITYSGLSHASQMADKDGGFTINWGAASNSPARYELYQRINSGGWSRVHNSSGRSKAVSVGNGSYHYRARACNSVGCGSFTATSTVSIEKTPGSTGAIGAGSLSHIEANQDNNGAYSVSWSAGSGLITSYRLQENVNGGGYTTVQQTSSRSRSLSGKSNGTYYYRVQACNSLSCSAWSPVKSVQVILPASAPPSVSITGLSDPSSYIDVDGSYSVQWGAASGAVTHYEIDEGAGGSLANNNPIWTRVYSGPSRTVTRNVTGGLYQYRVRSCNALGCSGYASSGPVLVPSLIPGAIDLGQTGSSDGNHTLSWAYELFSPTEVRIFKDDVYVRTDALSGRFITYNNLLDATYKYYFYFDSGMNIPGVPTIGAVGTTVVTVQTPVPTPTGFTINELSHPNLNADNDGSYRLSWQPVTGDISAYEVWERLVGGDWTRVFNSSESTAFRPSRGGIGTNYEYRVRVCKTLGCGDYSAAIPVHVVLRPLQPNPSTVTLAPSISEYGELTLGWSNTGGAEFYQVEKQLNGGSWTSLGNTTSLTLKDSGLGNGSYVYRVRACAESAVIMSCSTYSVTDPSTVSLGAGVSQPKEFATNTQLVDQPIDIDTDSKGRLKIRLPLMTPGNVNNLKLDLSLSFFSPIPFQGIFDSPDKREFKFPSELGHGWKLDGLSKIGDCSLFYPENTPENEKQDNLCLNGEQLTTDMALSTILNLPVQGGYKFRPTTSPDVLVESKGTTGTNVWFEMKSGGRLYRFGTSENSTVLAEQGASIEFWYLSEVVDEFGNKIYIDYGKSVYSRFTYPVSVRYGSASGNQKKIEFQYSKRNDASGNDVKTEEERKVAPVVLNGVRTSENNIPIHEYRLRHEQLFKYELLTGVQSCGYDETGNNPQCTAPASFDWGQWTDSWDFDASEVGIRRITDSLGNKTIVHYNRHASPNFGEVPANAVDPIAEQIGVHDWYEQQAFGEAEGCGVGCSLIPQSFDLFSGSIVTAFEKQFANGESNTTHYFRTLSTRTAPISVPVAEIKILSDGRHAYSAYRDGRLILSEIYDGIYGNAPSTLKHKESIIWKRLSSPGGGDACLSLPNLTEGVPAGCLAPISLMYKAQERQFILDENGSEIGGEFIDTTYTWDDDRKLPTQRVIKKVSGYGVYDIPIQSPYVQVKNGLMKGLNNVEQTTTTTTTFSNIITDNRWQVGFPTVEEVLQQRPNREAKRYLTTKTPISIADSPKVGRATFSFDDGSGYIEKTITDNIYSASGNLIETTLSGVDFATRSKYFENFYDNRLPQTIREDIDGVFTKGTHFTYDLRGNIKTSTDANDQVSTFVYDNFSRKIQSISPGGVTANTSIEACDISCGTVRNINGQQVRPVYRGVSEVTHPFESRQGAPTSINYYDHFNRVVRVETQGFNAGEWITADVVFDLTGRETKASMPYLQPGSPQFIDKQFDEQDRVTRLDRPDGSYVIYTYDQGLSGLTVTKEHHLKRTDGVAKIQTRVEYFNSLGQLLQTTDAAGTDDEVHTTFEYDAMGNNDSVQVNNNPNTTVQLVFDHLGNTIMLDDPDAGLIVSAYDSLGQLKTQTNARGVTTEFEYDLLGLLIKRTDDATGVLPGGPVVNTFTFHTRKIGALSTASAPGFVEQTYYNNLSQIERHETQINVATLNQIYSTEIAYDNFGRIETQNYPSGVHVKNNYNALGYAIETRDLYSNKLLNRIDATDQFGNVVQSTLGNGVVVSKGYDSSNGQLLSIQSGSAHSLQDLHYSWWSNNTLHQRNKNTVSATETFSYDHLNRLTNSLTTSGAGARQLSYDFDRLGNLLNKSSNIAGDDNASGFNYAGASGVHAVDSAIINGVRHDYTYDAAGNLTQDDAVSGADRSIIYNAYGKPISIRKTEQGDTVAEEVFQYGPGALRFYKRSVPSQDQTVYLYGGAIEITYPYSGSVMTVEKTTIGDVMHIREVTLASQTRKYEYLLKDHLGSVDVITGEDGYMVMANNFDPFGGYRNGNWSAKGVAPTALEQLQHSNRGFTGHEQLDSVGLIHMNGRVYDPLLGRFMSADPHVTFPTYSQSYNRYSYVLNNPLGMVDPTGYDPTCGTASAIPGGGGGSRCVVIDYAGDKDNEKSPESTAKAVAKPPVDDEEVDSGGAPGGGTNGDNSGGSGQEGVPHRYTVGPTTLCSMDSARCNMNHSLDVVNEASLPLVGLLSGQPKDGTMILLGNNPITHVIDRENFTVWNITQKGHDFHPGTVMHRLYVENGNIMLFTEGLGRGDRKSVV